MAFKLLRVPHTGPAVGPPGPGCCAPQPAEVAPGARSKARAVAVACSSLQCLEEKKEKKKIKFFPFRPRAFFFFFSPSSSRFRLPDVSSHPAAGAGARAARAETAVRSYKAWPGGLRRAESGGGGGASVAQGQSLRARLGAARAAGPGPGQGGPAGLPTSEAQALPAARPARTLRASRVPQLQPQRAIRAPSLHPSARPRGSGN